MSNFVMRVASLHILLVLASAASAQQPSSPQPERRPITQADRDLVNSPTIEKNIAAAVPKKASAENRKRLLALAHQSIVATRAGKGTEAAAAIKEFRNTGRGYGENPWEACGDLCYHFLISGDAESYAICYWACVARSVSSGGGVKPL